MPVATILIVEDEAILAMHLQEILTRQGYSVLKPVSSGEDAIRVSAQEKPELILMDIELAQQISGIEAAEKISAVCDAAIIFLTGFSQDAMLQKAKLSMPYGYLIKPVSERELVATLEMARYKRQMDAQIRQSESRYRTLVTQASDGIILADKDGSILEMNPAGLALLGYNEDEILRLNFHRLLNFDQASITQEEVMQGLRRGEGIRCECDLCTKDQTLLPVEIHGKILEDGCFQAIFRDISERKATERLTRQNEDRLRKIYEISQYQAKDIQDLLDFSLSAAIELTESRIGFIYLYDENKKEFTLNSWSKEVLQACSVMDPQTTYQLENTGFWGEVVRQRRALMDNDFQLPSPMKKGVPEGHVTLLKYLSIPVYSEGQIVAVVGVANKKDDYTETDELQLSLLMDSVWKIVERARAEGALRNSARQHEQLIHASLDGYVMLNGQGKILHVNDAYCHMSGYAASELLQMNISQVDVIESPQQTREHFEKVIQQGSDRFETRHRTKDGKILDIEVSSTYIPSTQYFMAFFRDVTRQKKNQAEIERWANIFQNAEWGVVVSTDGTHIEIMNPAFARMHGYTPEELKGRRVEEILARTARAELSQKIAIATQAGHHTWESRHLRKDGSTFPVLLDVTIVKDESGEILYRVINVQDITEQEEARNALQQKTLDYQFLAAAAVELTTMTSEDEVFEQILASMPQLLPDTFAVLMRTTSDRESLYLQGYTGINSGMMKRILSMIGRDLTSIQFALNDSFHEILSHTLLYPYPGGFEKFAETEIPRPIAAAIRKLLKLKDIFAIGIADGGHIFGGLYLFAQHESSKINAGLIESYMHQCYLALSRIHTQEHLVRSEERFRELSENIQETFWLRDQNTRQILYVSPQYEKTWGRSRQSLYENPQSFLDSIHPEDVERVVAAQRDAQLNSHDFNEEYRILHPDGDVHWIRARTYPVKDEAGLVQHMAGIAEDITERKKMEDQRKQVEEKFTKAFHTSPDSININRLADGLYLDVNEGFLSLTGYTREEVLGKTSAEINIWVDPADRARLVAGLRTQGKVENLEAEFRIKDGSTKTCLMSATIIDVSGETCILSITRDISDRKLMEEGLKEREKIFNHTLDMLCIAGFDGYFKVLNPAWGKNLGWSMDELMKDPWLTFVHPEDREATENIKAVIVGGQEVYKFENRFLCKDGSTRWLSWNSFPYPEEGIMFGVARDITEQKHMEDSLRFSENRYMLLFNEMEEGFALHEIICDENGHPTDYRFLEVNPAFERLTGLERDTLIGRTVREVMPATETYWIEAYGRVALQDETLHYENYAGELGKWFSVSAFSPKSGYFATTFIDITERKMADELLQNFALELNVAYDATLQGWSNALELREHETGGHSQRVVRQTLRLAQALGVDQAELIHIERGALLHDIGKMGIPDSILLKPGPLSDDEWQIMRQHPQYAYNLLREIDYLQAAIEIPYCHHEKWDGTGYPRQLKGENIPLAARIFAVIDVWDALSNDRPYRPAWEEKAILKYIREQSGKHFDPRVVDAFLALLTTEER